MLIKHSIIYFIGKVAPSILSMIGVLIYTRMISPEEYGLFSLISVTVGLLNILFFQWIRSSFIRFYNEREHIKSFIGSTLKSHIVTLVILGFPTVIIALFLYYNSYSVVYLFLGYIMVVVHSLFELFIIYFRTTLNPLTITKVNIIKSIIIIKISTILIYLGIGTKGLLLGTILGTTFGVIIYFNKIDKNNLSKITLRSNWNTQKKFLKYGLPITFSFGLSVTMQNIDKIMISSILGLEANGNYAVGYDLIHNLIYMIMTSISLASFPLILKTIKKSGDESGKKQFKEYIKLLLFISIPACFGLASILNEFTGIIVGKDYTISNTLMILIIFASLFHGLKSHYFDLTLQISGKTSNFFVPSLLAVILNIILNLYLLNKFGIEGAAVATAFSFLFAMILSSIFSYKYYKVPIPWKDTIKISLTSLIMFILIRNISMDSLFASLIIKVLTGGAVYLIISYILNTVGIKTTLQNYLLKKVRK